MVKRIGKYLWMFILFNTAHAHIHLKLKMFDMDGNAMAQAIVQEPFLLEVSVIASDGDTVPTAIPTIEGIKNVVVDERSHASTINSIINGRRTSTKIYRFVVRAEHEGSLEIGPAWITIDKKRLLSDMLKLKVEKRQKGSVMQPFIEASFDKEEVYVGQLVTYRLRFFPAQKSSLDGISQPEFSDFYTESFKGPITGQQVIDGNAQQYLEWRATLYPKNVGALTVSAVSAVYTVARRRSNRFDIFDRVFSTNTEQRRVYSNAVTLQVKPLPDTNQDVRCIGVIDTARASLDHAQAKEGEAVVYKITIEGKGNLQAMQPPKLILPEGLKYYESNSQFEQLGNQCVKKSFDYIMQGIKPGTWEIPAQSLVYFDPEKEQYSTITTNEVALIIQEKSSNICKDLPAVSCDVNSQEQTISLLIDGAICKSESYTIPWFIMVLVSCIPGIVFALRSRKNVIHQYYATFMQRRNIRMAFDKIEKQLRTLEQERNYTELIALFNDLFIQKCGLPHDMLTETETARILERLGIDGGLCQSWKRFYILLLSLRYVQKNDGINIEAIFTEAKQWLTLLKNYL